MGKAKIDEKIHFIASLGYARGLVFFLLLLMASCGKGKMAAPEKVYPVRIERAVCEETPVFIEALGHVDPIISIEIRSRIEGELVGVHFEQGKEVRQGDLLFTIDPLPYQAILKETTAQLAQNRAQMALAEEKVKRYRGLVQEEYFSQIDYETLQTQFASAAAQVEQSQAAVDRAHINLNYCWIYAPINGATGLLQIDYGNLVSADGSKPLVTLNQLDPIFITFSIPEFKLPLLQQGREGLKVLAAYEHFDEQVFQGTLQVIDNEVGKETGMIKLRALFANPDRKLWPGQFIRTRTILYTLQNAVVIPYAAVHYTASGPVVFIVAEDRSVDMRPVKLGQRKDSQVVVLEGVKAEETVVVEGQINLSSGVKVREVRP